MAGDAMKRLLLTVYYFFYFLAKGDPAWKCGAEKVQARQCCVDCTPGYTQHAPNRPSTQHRISSWVTSIKNGYYYVKQKTVNGIKWIFSKLKGIFTYLFGLFARLFGKIFSILGSLFSSPPSQVLTASPPKYGVSPVTQSYSPVSFAPSECSPEPPQPLAEPVSSAPIPPPAPPRVPSPLVAPISSVSPLPSASVPPSAPPPFSSGYDEETVADTDGSPFTGEFYSTKVYGVRGASTPASVPPPPPPPSQSIRIPTTATHEHEAAAAERTPSPIKANQLKGGVPIFPPFMLEEISQAAGGWRRRDEERKGRALSVGPSTRQYTELRERGNEPTWRGRGDEAGPLPGHHQHSHYHPPYLSNDQLGLRRRAPRHGSVGRTALNWPPPTNASGADIGKELFVDSNGVLTTCCRRVVEKANEESWRWRDDQGRLLDEQHERTFMGDKDEVVREAPGQGYHSQQHIYMDKHGTLFENRSRQYDRHGIVESVVRNY